MAQQVLNILNKTAALEAIFNPPPVSRIPTARSPLMCAIYGDDPLCVNEAYCQTAGVRAQEMRDAFSQGGQQALKEVTATGITLDEAGRRKASHKGGHAGVNNLLFGVDAKSSRDAQKLVRELDQLGHYRLDAGPYPSGVHLRSSTVVLRRPDKNKTWGSLRILQDVTRLIEKNPEARVKMVRNGKIYGYDQFLPGERWTPEERAAGMLKFSTDVKSLPKWLQRVANYRGSDGDKFDRAIHDALQNLTAIALVTDHVWSCGMYLMRLTDHNGLRPNLAMADAFGSAPERITSLAREEKYKDHYYPRTEQNSLDERSFVEQKEADFRRDGYYFETFHTLTDHQDEQGKRILRTYSWDRYALHEETRRKLIESFSQLFVPEATLGAAANADLRVGLEEPS